MFVPFTSETFTSTLRPQEVAEAILAATERHPLFANFGLGGRPFVGDARDDRFIIRPRIAYRNPFVPIIEGRIESGNATNLAIFARPSWPALAAVGATSILGLVLAAGAGWDLIVVLFAVMPWLMCAVGYAIEAEKVERLLSDLIKISPVPPR
jgi:hypothetical protein